MNSPNLFSDNERIVRNIYSPKTVNPNNNNLKANFVAFSFQAKSGKYELSCNRLEIDTMDNLRLLGAHYAPPKSAYYGVACISVQLIKTLKGLDLASTPILDRTPQNPSHCDIYDYTIPPPGELYVASDAEVNYRRSVFVKLWKAYKDDGTLLKEKVQPIALN